MVREIENAFVKIDIPFLIAPDHLLGIKDGAGRAFGDAFLARDAEILSPEIQRLV